MRFFCIANCLRMVKRTGLDAEEIQGFVGTRNTSAGDSERRRRRTDLQRVRGRVARKLPGDGGYVRGDAGGGGRTPEPVVRGVSRTIWRAYSADTARGCEGISAAAPTVAGAAVGSERGAETRGGDGDGGGAGFPRGGERGKRAGGLTTVK